MLGESICRKTIISAVQGARTSRTATILSALATVCSCAFALNPSLGIGQYAHSSWTSRDDNHLGLVYAFAQTLDGYLWIGTEFGLLRFDGTRFVSWQPPAPQRLPNVGVSALFVSRDGRLWIGTAKGLVSWKD